MGGDKPTTRIKQVIVNQVTLKTKNQTKQKTKQNTQQRLIVQINTHNQQITSRTQ